MRDNIFPGLNKILKSFQMLKLYFKLFKCHDNQKDVEKFLTGINLRKVEGDKFGVEIKKIHTLSQNSVKCNFSQIL